MKLSLPALLTVFLLFTARLASAQDYIVYEMTGETREGTILKENDDFLVMKTLEGEKLKVKYIDIRSYSHKGQLYQRRHIASESPRGNGLVTEVIKGKVTLYASNGWAPTTFAMAPAGGPGMMTTGGGGKMTYYYIDKVGERGGLRNPIATGLLTGKRLTAARQVLLDLMGDDEVLAYKINNESRFDIKMITHYVTEYNKRNPQ